MKKALILTLMHLFLGALILKGQVTNKDKCEIYSQIICELKVQVKKDYNQNELFVANHLLIIDDIVSFINTINPLFDDELLKLNIDYKKFVHRTDDFNFDCFSNKIKIIKEGDYYSKQKKYSRKRKGFCYFSNIGYFNNYAFVAVMVHLSYSRRYSNFYFFQKDSKWNIIYFKEGCD